MQLQRFTNQITNGHARIQAGQGILENQLQLAAQRRQLSAG